MAIQKRIYKQIVRKVGKPKKEGGVVFCAEALFYSRTSNRRHLYLTCYHGIFILRKESNSYTLRSSGMARTIENINEPLLTTFGS